MQRKIIHTTSTKIGPTRCGPVVTKELFQTRLPSCLRDGKLTYPKPNFLTFGQYIKNGSPKKFNFFISREFAEVRKDIRSILMEENQTPSNIPAIGTLQGTTLPETNIAMENPAF